MSWSAALRYSAAAAFAVPVGGMAWFELIYLFFGITGEDPPWSYNALGAAAAFGVALVWPLFGTTRAAEVVRRSCRLGGVVAVLLPLVALAVLMLWQRASGRPDLGMGGLMLYSLPVIAFVVALAFVLVLWLCDRVAAGRLREDEGPAL